MPTFNNDHISNALSNTFNVRNGSKSVVKKMETSIRKSLLTPVQFDDPIVHSKCTVKTSYIILSTSSTSTSLESNGESNNSHIPQSVTTKSAKVKSVDQVPAAKITLFRKEM